MLSHSVVSDSLWRQGQLALQAPLSMGFSRQEYWSGLPCPPPGHLPNLGIEPNSPTLQAPSLPAEPPGKPMNTGVGSLSLLQGIFPTQLSYRGLFLVSMHFRHLGAVWIHLFGTDHSTGFFGHLGTLWIHLFGTDHSVAETFHSIIGVDENSLYVIIVFFWLWRCSTLQKHLSACKMKTLAIK